MLDQKIFGKINEELLTDLPRGFNEGYYQFLKRSSSAHSKKIRNFLETCFETYDGDPRARNDILSRIRAKNDQLFDAASFELLLHRVLVCQGLNVSVHYEMPNGTKPDFLVTLDDGKKIVIELVTYNSKFFVFKEKVKGIIERILGKSFNDFKVFIIGGLDEKNSTDAFETELRKWSKKKEGDFFWCKDRFFIRVVKKENNDKSSGFEVVFENYGDLLFSKIKNKTTKYFSGSNDGDFDFSYIIAITDRDRCMKINFFSNPSLIGDDNINSILYGATESAPSLADFENIDMKATFGSFLDVKEQTIADFKNYIKDFSEEILSCNKKRTGIFSNDENQCSGRQQLSGVWVLDNHIVRDYCWESRSFFNMLYLNPHANIPVPENFCNAFNHKKLTSDGSFLVATVPSSEEERLAIVREVAAEMNAESDAKATVVVGDDGVVEAVPK